MSWNCLKNGMVDMYCQIFQNMLVSRLLRSSTFRNTFKFSNFAANQASIEKFRAMLPKHRENPIIMKLDSDDFNSLFNDELRTLASLFKEYNYEIRIAGGAVRDLLMGIKPQDLDFATTATPDQMKDMFTAENVRMINANGEKHGTITPRINDKVNFEVTTLRIDAVTDGRHAEVIYTTDWLLDANRRDLTINSMFLDLDGSVYDYFFGYDDISKRRVAFVGDATTRIQEDYLRILRYFRFYGRISTHPNKHEEATLTCIKENAQGLQQISGERIWTELKKILEGNYAGDLLKLMLDCNIAPYIGLPENCNVNELNDVWNRSMHLNMHAITLLTSIINTEEEALKLHARIKFSAFERDLMLFIIQHRGPKLNVKPLHPYKSLVATGKHKNVRQYVIEVLKYINSPFIKEFEEWQCPKFPVHGAMLTSKGVGGGKFMGLVINELKEIWAENDFIIEGDELMKHLPSVLLKLEDKRKNKKSL